MKIYQTKENTYISEILNEICQTVFSKKITNLLDINSELDSTKCIVNIDKNTLYIKFSSVQDFIKKDYDIKWVLQDLNISLQPISFGFLKSFELYYSIFNYNNVSLYEEEKIEASSILNSVINFYSIKLERNNNIGTAKDFFLKRYVFDNFYSCFPESLKEDFLNLTCTYGEMYEKLQLEIKNYNLIGDENILLHGNLGERSIANCEENICLYNFENSFYGHPAIDVCLLDINLKLNKSSFLQKSFPLEGLNLDNLLYSYKACLLKKACDFIFDIIFKYFAKEINSKDKLVKNFLDLTFYSQIEEINLIKDSISNIINHSNV
jgi:hypothetical protein